MALSASGLTIHAQQAAIPAGQPVVSTDVIVWQDGTEVAARIEEVRPTEITYRRADNPAGPLYTESRAAIFKLKYANGTEDVFAAEPAPAARVALPADWPYSLTYARPELDGPLSAMWVPQEFSQDTLVRRRFELGRRVGHHTFTLHKSVAPAAPPTPLPVALLPYHDDTRSQLALRAYTDGYERQLHRERASRADTHALLLGLLAPLAILLGITITTVATGP